MTPADLAKFEPARRYATLVAVVLEAMATVIDEIVDLNDRIIGTLFNRARHSHEQQFQQSGKAINEKVRFLDRIGQALLGARQSGGDPFAAIEAVIPWEDVHAERDRGEATGPTGETSTTCTGLATVTANSAATRRLFSKRCT